MSNRKINYRQAAFLYSHGWSPKEIAKVLGCHTNTVFRAVKAEGLTTNHEPDAVTPATVGKAIKATKERIEFLLNHHNPCEFTWRENLIELLQGFQTLVQRRHLWSKIDRR